MSTSYKISRLVNCCPCGQDLMARMLLACPEFLYPRELATQLAAGAQLYELGVDALPGELREHQEGKPAGLCDPISGLLLPLQDVRERTRPPQDVVFAWLDEFGCAQYLGAIGVAA